MAETVSYSTATGKWIFLMKSPYSISFCKNDPRDGARLVRAAADDEQVPLVDGYAKVLGIGAREFNPHDDPALGLIQKNVRIGLPASAEGTPGHLGKEAVEILKVHAYL